MNIRSQIKGAYHGIKRRSSDLIFTTAPGVKPLLLKWIRILSKKYTEGKKGTVPKDLFKDVKHWSQKEVLKV